MAYSVKIDLHGHTVESARQALNLAMNTLGKDTREVVVIHGFHGGTALRDMVRKYKHPKLKRKILGLNQGETIFEIKDC